MSEKDIFDEKLANKFRETFEDYEAAYNPADWEQLRSALPSSPLMSVWRNPLKKKWITVAASITALIVVAYLSLKPKSETGQLSQVTPQEVVTNENTLPPIKEETKQEATENNQVEQKISEENHALENQVQEKNKKAPLPNAYEETVQNNTLIAKNNNPIFDKSLDETAVKQIITEEKTSITSIEGNKNKIVVDLLPIYQDSLGFLYQLALPTPKIELVALQQEQETKKPKRNVSFGLAVNPIVFKNELGSQFTVETGLQVGVPIASRVRLTTGLFVANQKMQYANSKGLTRELAFYPADMDKQNAVGVTSAPRENWVEVASSMRNNFAMLNIPVHLQYDFMYGEKIRLFASIGVSNYAYFSERYIYENNVTPYYISTTSRFPTTGNIGNTFGVPTNYDVNYERSYDAFSQVDLGSSINLSSGVEFQISNHFSLQASPFVRIPVRRIGHHGLAFDTFGMAVIMNYK